MEKKIQRKALFNEKGDIELSKRRLINGNTTNLNDFNNVKYAWTNDWYRQAMNNFWIPEERTQILYQWRDDEHLLAGINLSGIYIMSFMRKNSLSLGKNYDCQLYFRGNLLL